MVTAAMPTPPVAAWTRSLRPGWGRPRSVRAYQAVANATGTAAACATDQPGGTGIISRASATATAPKPPGPGPRTRSPGTRWVTPGPVSVTTPAISLPI